MNRARAIVHYRRALDVRRDEGNSHRFAQTLNALGTAYWELRHMGGWYLGLAREALEEVTELRLRLGRLDEALGSAQNLSRVLAAQSAWPEILTLGERLFFDNDLRLKDTSTPAEAERLVSAFGRIVDMMALAALERDGPKDSIDVLLRGRARLAALREGFDEENSDRMREITPDELLVITLVPIPPNPIHLIMIYRDVGGELCHRTARLGGFSQLDLDEMIYGETEDSLSWIHAYQDVHLKNDRSRLAEMLDVVGDRLGQEFSSVSEILEGSPHLRNVTWAPSGAFSILPLGRCRIDEHAPLNERIPCRVATSLRASVGPTRKIGQGRIISFSDPEGNLPFGRIEGDVLREHFPQTELFTGESATREVFFATLSGSEPIDLAHFSCHGRYRWSDPSASQLNLADGPVTVAEIREHISLAGAPVVVLSACEVGISDFRQLPTENFGMPSVWLAAGAAAVVAPLWPVADLQALELMRIYFAGLANGAPFDQLPICPDETQRVVAATSNRWIGEPSERLTSDAVNIGSWAFQVFTR